MDISCEHHSVLSRVDGFVQLIGRWNGGPAAVVRLIPEILICQREDRSEFEDDPSPVRTKYTHFSYNTSTIVLTYDISKQSDAGSRMQRKGTK